jgi:hypothetical protein
MTSREQRELRTPVRHAPSAVGCGRELTTSSPPPRPRRRRVHRAWIDDRRGRVLCLHARCGSRGQRPAGGTRTRRDRRVRQRDLVGAACGRPPHVGWHLRVRSCRTRAMVGVYSRLGLCDRQDGELRRNGAHLRGLCRATRMGAPGRHGGRRRARGGELVRRDSHGTTHARGRGRRAARACRCGGCGQCRARLP